MAQSYNRPIRGPLWQGSLCLIVVVLLGLCSTLWAVEFQYAYDALDRLVRVTDSDGNVTAYVYDAAGNIVAIIHATTADTPMITGVTPDRLNQGETVEVVVTGSNFSLASLSTNNPGLRLDNVQATATEVRATVFTALDAPLGPATLTVTTVLGAASTPLTVLGPLPRLLSLFPAQGSADGGTLVTLAGLHFTPDTMVTLGGRAVLDPVFVNASTITARTPVGALSALVDVVLSNGNGSSTLANAFLYTFPFRIPGAVAVATGGTGRITVSLAEPRTADTTVAVANTNPAVATVPASVLVPAGARTVDILVTAISTGTTTLTVTIGEAQLTTTVFVTAPATGTLEAVASAAGVGIGAPPLALTVGTEVAPTLLATLALSRNATRTITVELAEAAPIGGLCVALSLSNPALATIPSQVCINVGEKTVSFAVTALVAGEAVIILRAGTEVRQFSLLVGGTLGIPGGALAAPVGGYVTPLHPAQGTALAPIAGTFVPPDEPPEGTTLAPVVGVRVP